MISFGARVVKTIARLYTYPYRKNHLSLSRNIHFSTKPYKIPKGYEYKIENFGGINVEILTPPNHKTDKIILHFHGGGCTTKMNNFYRKIAKKYCDISGYAVVSIDYKVGLELVHPAMLNDCYTAYNSMLNAGLDTKKVIMVGDSMGANLMFSVCFKLRNDGKDLPIGMVAVSPCVDLSASGESYHKNCYADPLYSLTKNQKYEDYEQEIKRISPYCGDTDKQDCYLSPAFGDYTGFNKVLIQVGTSETSESDSDMLYDRMTSANVPVTLHKFEDMFHDFQYFVPFLKESKQAWKEIAEFIIKL